LEIEHTKTQQQALLPPCQGSPLTTRIEAGVAMCLLQLTYSRTTKVSLLKCEAIGSLVSACMHTRDESVLSPAMGALCNFALEEEGAIDIVQSGGVPVLLDTMRTTQNNQTLRGCCGALCGITVIRHFIQMVADQDGVDVLLKICEINTDAEVLTRATATIYHLTKNVALTNKMAMRRGSYSAIARAQDFLSADAPNFLQELLEKLRPGLKALIRQLNLPPEIMTKDATGSEYGGIRTIPERRWAEVKEEKRMNPPKKMNPWD
jgi:hypothetical protein